MWPPGYFGQSELVGFNGPLLFYLHYFNTMFVKGTLEML